MKGPIEQYEWKVFGAFKNESTHLVKQIKGLIERLVLKKKTY